MSSSGSGRCSAGSPSTTGGNAGSTTGESAASEPSAYPVIVNASLAGWLTFAPMSPRHLRSASLHQQVSYQHHDAGRPVRTLELPRLVKLNESVGGGCIFCRDAYDYKTNSPARRYSGLRLRQTNRLEVIRA